jgi:hypothetical protein
VRPRCTTSRNLYQIVRGGVPRHQVVVRPISCSVAHAAQRVRVRFTSRSATFAPEVPPSTNRAPQPRPVTSPRIPVETRGLTPGGDTGHPNPATFPSSRRLLCDPLNPTGRMGGPTENPSVRSPSASNFPRNRAGSEYSRSVRLLLPPLSVGRHVPIKRNAGAAATDRERFFAAHVAQRNRVTASGSPRPCDLLAPHAACPSSCAAQPGTETVVPRRAPTAVPFIVRTARRTVDLRSTRTRPPNWTPVAHTHPPAIHNESKTPHRMKVASSRICRFRAAYPAWADWNRAEARSRM